MIELNLYRSRIGRFDPCKGNVKYSRRQSMPNKQGSPYQCMFSFKSLVNVSWCLLYLYFITVVLTLCMCISISMPKRSLLIPSLSHSYQFKNEFHNLVMALVHVKYLFCIFMVVIYRTSLSSKKVSRYVIYRLYLKHTKLSHRISKMNKLCQSVIFWLSILNFLLITIINPGLLNPGPPRANQSVQTRPLKILYNNVQGFVNPRDLKSESPPLNATKIYEFQSYIYKHKPDIIVVNESWIKKAILDEEILPKSFNFIRADRSGKTHPWDPTQPKKFRRYGGGIFIAFRKDIDLEGTEVKLIKVKAEILTVNFKLPTGKRFSLSTFYRVGTLGIENFDLIKNYLKTLACKKKLDKHLLIGDFNFPEVVWPDSSTSVELHKNFIEFLMTELNHSQLITNTTHKNGKMLDLLFTNIPELIKNITVLGRNEICSSDHFGITFNLKLDVSIKKTVKRQEYDYSKADWKGLNFDLKKINWNYFVEMQDPHISWQFFKAIITNLCDQHIPKKSVHYQFQPPWFDTDCDRMLREKEKWRAKAHSESGTEEDHEKFRKFRKKFKTLMNEKMRLNVVDESDPFLISKKFWKHVKSKSKSGRIPETIWYKNAYRTNLVDQANLFNKFFFEQFSEKSSYEIDIDMHSEDQFMNLKFHELDVLMLLKDVNSSKAAGPDDIHGTVLKNCAVPLAKPLTMMFNNAFVTGCIPDDWKLASIVPIHKKDEKGSVENYRPISLTSLIMKVFEKCIRKELFSSCEKFLDPRQHGFINGKSCTTQMVSFTYDLAVTLNNKSKSDVIYFDFAKAFDSVSHDLILKKLKNNFGIDGLMLRFIKAYLQGRKQQVVIGGVNSSVLPVNSGVPQGSILGPLLFVLFINDMFNSISSDTNIALYADDTKIWREIIYSKDHFTLQKDIDKLFEWSLANKMKFHPSKCKALSVTNQQNILHNLPFTIFNYKLGSVYIDYVGSQVDLGVTVNSKLLWTEHCEKLVKNANSKLALLMRTCHFTVNKQQKRAFYLTVVRSLFEHCSIIWHPISPNQILKFEAIQKRAIKWINGQQFDHYTDNEYMNRLREFNILPIKCKFALNDLMLYFKIINQLIEIKLPEHFSFIKPEEVRYTRKTAPIIKDLDVTQVKCCITPSCDVFRNSFFYRTMILWNSLPYGIRQEVKISLFKSQVIKFLKSADLDWPD